MRKKEKNLSFRLEAELQTPPQFQVTNVINCTGNAVMRGKLNTVFTKYINELFWQGLSF